MKSIFLWLFTCVVSACSVEAQIVDAAFCDILAHPTSFDGKIVRIKGTVIAGFDEFAVKGLKCGQPVNAIWLAYPEGTKAKAGPVAFAQLQLARNNPVPVAPSSRAPVKLEKNKDFKQFDSPLSTSYKGGGMCLGCVRYTVTATLVGRLDGSNEAGVVRDSTGKFVGANGFGNLNHYRARLVLQSVSDVASQEIDYSQAAAVAKNDSTGEAGGGDPVAAAHQVARAFPAGSAAAGQVERAAAAYGKKEGEDNGVQVGFGVPNEVPRSDSVKGEHDSPDGLLFNCTFDMERLKGSALTRAISHVGNHIADLRETGSQAAENAYDLEYRAWQTTVLSALASQQKTLTLAGGFLVWNSDWSVADRSKMVDDEITKFLMEWASLSK